MFYYRTHCNTIVDKVAIIDGTFTSDTCFIDVTVIRTQRFFGTAKTFGSCIVRTCLSTAFLFIHILFTVHISLNESSDLMVNRYKWINEEQIFRLCLPCLYLFVFYRTWKFHSITCPFLGAYSFEQFFNCDLSIHIAVKE